MYVINLETGEQLQTLPSEAFADTALALGSFDGVHLGHAALIGRAVKIACERGLAPAVFTFNEEPGVIPSKAGARSLTDLKEKLSLIASLGAKFALLEDFSRIRGYSPERFVSDILVRDGHAKCAVCGFNFRFGAGGSGTCETLRELMPDGGCEIVEPVTLDGLTVSSSEIRRLLEDGNVERAARLLGREFSLELPVVHGKELGRTLGLPTVNQNPPKARVIPANGIYAASVELDGRRYKAVTNVGSRPTTDGDSAAVNLETHIIGFDGDLYGRLVRVCFARRLRDERRFDSLAELQAQIRRDIAAALL